MWISISARALFGGSLFEKLAYWKLLMQVSLYLDAQVCCTPFMFVLFAGYRGQVAPGLRATTTGLVDPLGGDGRHRPRRSLQSAKVRATFLPLTLRYSVNRLLDVVADAIIILYILSLSKWTNHLEEPFTAWLFSCLLDRGGSLFPTSKTSIEKPEASVRVYVLAWAPAWYMFSLLLFFTIPPKCTVLNWKPVFFALN